MYSLVLSAIILTGSLTLALYRRELGNDTLQQQISEAGFYSRVTNGLPAAPTQFPYQVGLRLFRHQAPVDFCGGSLISKEWVLTAAHCTLNCLFISVLIGNIELSKRQIQIKVTKDKIKAHKKFAYKTGQHDIAVIEIPAVLFSDTIAAINLPPREKTFPTYVGEYAVLAGWGFHNESIKVLSPTLQYSVFPTISNKDCVGAYDSSRIYDGKLCTATAGGISACNGDSGGSLVLVRTMIQIGIYSFHHRLGCESGQPNAFTRVSSYLRWIKKKTGLDV